MTILALGCVSPTPEAEPTPTPPPEPPPVTETEPLNENPSLVQRADGSCYLVMPSSCPEGARCNPPPPRTTPCPALTTTALVRLDGGCEQRGEWRCDDGITCEQSGKLPAECPPLLSEDAPGSRITKHHLYGCTHEPAGGGPNTPVLCPPDMERPPPPNVSFTPEGDGICLAVRAVSCPPHISCNPPAPQPVICPPDLR